MLTIMPCHPKIGKIKPDPNGSQLGFAVFREHLRAHAIGSMPLGKLSFAVKAVSTGL